MRETTCCFAGNRKLPAGKIESIIKRLNDEMENLIHQGVTNFISGGAVGFDMIAASLVIAKRELGYPIKLEFALPCRNQGKYWPEQQIRLYQELLNEADAIHYISNEYSFDSMKKRNRFMVDHADVCICCLLEDRGGTFRTASYARKRGIKVVNVAR